MPKSKLHIIWDLDGTLIDSAPEIKEVLDKSVKEAGFSEIEPVKPFRSGPPLDKVLEYMYGDRLSEKNINQIVFAFRKNYDNCGFNNTLGFEGIEDILKDNFFIHHIITNKPDLATNKIIEKLGWKHYFESIVTPYSYMKSLDDKRKSKTELFKICISKYPKHFFIGIGDMVSDCYAANENRIPAIGVLWGTGTENDFKSCGCSFIAKNVNDLKIILQNKKKFFCKL